MSPDTADSVAQSGETRSVSFSLTEEDLVAFEEAAKVRLSRPTVSNRFPRASRRRRAECEAKLVFFALGVVGLFTIAPAELQESISSLFRPLPAFLLGIAVGLALVVAPLTTWIFVRSGGSASRERLKQSRRRALRARRTIKISSTDVEHDDGVCTSFTKWTGVEEIVETKGLVLLFTDVMVASVIPNRAFADETDRAEFLRVARSYHEQYGPRETSVVGTAPGPT